MKFAFLTQDKAMRYKDTAYALERIRALESELSAANPTRAAKLTKELVRLKASAFRAEKNQ